MKFLLQVFERVKESSSLDDFKQKMSAIYEDLSNKLTYYPNYLFARIYFDVFISSLEFWPNIIIGNNTTKAASFWDRVKDEWNNHIKPVLNEDATWAVAGGIGGAAAGAIAGGVGAIPGAIAGAVGGGVSASVKAGMDIAGITLF